MTIAPNTISRPYRGLSVQHVDIPLTPSAIQRHLLGREVYRRTEYLALRNSEDRALIRVLRRDDELFTPVVGVDVLAVGDEIVWIDDPHVDVGNATALSRATERHHTSEAKAYLIKGRFEHINFIWQPDPVTVRVCEVVPPTPPKLLAMAEQAIAFDEDLPPIRLECDPIDIVEIAQHAPAPTYLLPCAGSGADLGAPTRFLDAVPQRSDWLLIGCERSMQFHRHFYGDEPPQVDICPSRQMAIDSATPTLTKCCLLERGVEVRGSTVVVPWGATLDEVRQALRHLTGPSVMCPSPER